MSVNKLLCILIILFFCGCSPKPETRQMIWKNGKSGIWEGDKITGDIKIVSYLRSNIKIVALKEKMDPSNTFGLEIEQKSLSDRLTYMDLPPGEALYAIINNPKNMKRFLKGHLNFDIRLNSKFVQSVFVRMGDATVSGPSDWSKGAVNISVDALKIDSFTHVSLPINEVGDFSEETEIPFSIYIDGNFKVLESLITLNNIELTID